MKMMRVYVEIVTDDGKWEEYSTGMVYDVNHKELLDEVCHLLSSMNGGV